MGSNFDTEDTGWHIKTPEQGTGEINRLAGLSKARIGRAGITNGQWERESRKIVNWLETSLRLSGFQEFNEVKNKDENKLSRQKHEWYVMEKSN